MAKAGDARVSLIGFPSVGKSSFLSKVTNTKSEAANYEFTTLTSVGGILEYNGAEVQIVDLPGLLKLLLKVKVEVDKSLLCQELLI